MSIYASFDGGSPTLLASNRGWSDFIRWAESVESEPLTHLTNHGWWEPVDKLRAALAEALVNKPSHNPAILDTAKELLSLLDDGEVITINDGIGPDMPAPKTKDDMIVRNLD